MKVVHARFIVTAVAAILVAACGGGASASLSPLGPSASGGVATGASISGQVNMTSAAPLVANRLQMQDAHGITISIAGTGISTTANGQGQFTLTNVPAGDVTLTISGGGANATVTISGVGPNDQVQITVTVNGGSAHVDSEHHSAPGNGNGETVGTIASIDTTAGSFVIGTTTVTTTPTTVIRHGNATVAFSALKVGDHVEVRGTKTGTTIAATEIKVETPGDDQGDDDGGDQNGANEISGVVAALAGTCPAVTFTVSTTKVSTTSTTMFQDACSSLKNGAKVEVTGTKQTDGSIAATKVSIDN